MDPNEGAPTDEPALSRARLCADSLAGHRETVTRAPSNPRLVSARP